MWTLHPSKTLVASATVTISNTGLPTTRIEWPCQEHGSLNPEKLNTSCAITRQATESKDLNLGAVGMPSPRPFRAGWWSMRSGVSPSCRPIARLQCPALTERDLARILIWSDRLPPRSESELSTLIDHRNRRLQAANRGVQDPTRTIPPPLAAAAEVRKNTFEPCCGRLHGADSLDPFQHQKV